MKWVVEESDSGSAETLLTDGDTRPVAPDHLIGEVANGLRRRVAQQSMSVADALQALALDLDAELVTADRRVVEAARRHDLPVRLLGEARRQS